jgi:hypothetical protein
MGISSDMGTVKIFRHCIQIDLESKKIREFGDPLQKSEVAKRIYRELFDRFKNEEDWMDRTKRVLVGSWTEAQLIAEALTFFLGGAEIENCESECYKVGSKGYRHYLEN